MRSVPMLFVLGGLAAFVVGGLTGVMVAVAPFDFQVHDTYFIVSHLHYVLIGGTIFPILAGVHYWMPLVNGKQLSEKLGRISFWILFTGFNLTFFPMHLTGLLGMPRRVFTYPADLGVGTLNLVSTAGAFILAAGFLVFLWDVFRPRKDQPLSERNPWGAATLEWLAEMPGESWGTRSIPEIDSRYPLWDQPDLMENVDEGRFYLSDAPEGKRETIITSTIDARPLQCLRVSGPTALTFLAALFTGGFFIFGTFHMWWPALASGLMGGFFILRWLWTGTSLIPEKEERDVGLGLTLPLYRSGPDSVGWWAMFITMMADLTAFAGLVFGYFFYWTVHQDFPPEGVGGPGWLWPALALGLLLGAWALTAAARSLNGRESGAAFFVSTGAAAVLAAGGVAALVAGPWTGGMDPTAHAYSAIVWLLVGWTAVHVGIGVVMHLYCVARRWAERLTPRYDIDIATVALYWHFMAVTVGVTVAVIAGAPLVAGGLP